MRDSILICFIGIDGSGKTTLANDLSNEMKDHGIKIRCVYGRFLSPMLGLLVTLVKKVLSLKGKNMDDYAHRVAIKEQLFKNRLVAQFYQYFVFLNYVPKIFISIKLPLMLGQSIVCDRYVYDSVVDLAMDFRYTDERLQAVLRSYLRFIPKPDLVFLIDLPERIAFQRGKDDIPSITFLSKRRSIYLKMSKWNQMTILDGTKDIQELSEIVRNVVFTNYSL